MKQTFLALMKVASLLEEYDQLHDLLKQHSKYLDRAPASVSFEFLNLGNSHVVDVKGTKLADILHQALRAEIKKRIDEVATDLQRLNDKLSATVLFPRADGPLDQDAWQIPYFLLRKTQDEVIKQLGSSPALETIETILLAAEKYAQHKEETNGNT